ncbi:MAG: hypothetical protein EBS68_15275 [Rhodobacteraceae bacterium]|nr:hypothetical protein [Paracoccaceae bacterium]
MAAVLLLPTTVCLLNKHQNLAQEYLTANTGVDLPVKVCKALKVCKVYKVRRVHKAPKVLQVYKVYRVYKDLVISSYKVLKV